ncbi:hypothetical protein GCM10010326_26120 [Streptomyces xanthochromogenes]|uniref:Uncharacterized protein n=1 Tax=Streptomyces xanthochromogenes TaxID=67384 RepID=A0ABQ2ZZP8_9ACTN|nr:hypothetical protein GCM10010326_26120 [Streptomyces xanthochromogenes]
MSQMRCLAEQGDGGRPDAGRLGEAGEELVRGWEKRRAINSWNSNSEPGQRCGTHGRGSLGALWWLTCDPGDRVGGCLVNPMTDLAALFHLIRLLGPEKGLCSRGAGDVAQQPRIKRHCPLVIRM